MGASPPVVPAAPAWLGPALLVLVFASLVFWSFGKWTDVQIDFGTELYIPWQLTEGKVLYRDIAYRNGPLSPYLNAGAFTLFGVSLRTLVVCNLLILAGLTALLHRFFRRLCGSLAAACASVAFLCIFGFSQYVWVANYNYVTPYQHAQTHGLVLAVVMISLLVGALRELRPGRLAAAGFCLGLVALTKAEILVPAAAAAGTALLLLRFTGGDGRAIARGALLFAAMALVPAVVSILALATAMSVSEAVAATLGNWRYAGAQILGDPFYAWVSGVAAWQANGAKALAAAVALALAALALVAVDRLAGARGRAIGPALAAAAAAGLLWAPDLVAWAAVPRALPVVSLVCAVGFAWRSVVGRGHDAVAADRAAGLAVWSVFSLALLGKILLHTRIPHYGFVLAMPATLLLIVLFVWWLPRRARALGGTGAVCGGLALALLLSALVFWLRLSDTWYRAKDLPVAEGADRIWVASPPESLRGVRVSEALAAVEAASPPGASLLVLPEGSILNYWLRRENPSRYHLFLPAELAAYGSEAVLADVRRRPPDTLVLMHRRHGEFGVGPFGRDDRFGRELLAWVRERYARVEIIGGEPFAEGGFGVEILRRRER